MFDDERYDIIHLKRNGHRVEATMTCSAGADSGKCYSLTGSFRNLILSATYETEDRRGLDRGAMTLMLTENGRMLKGFLTGYSDDEHEIRDTVATWYCDKTEFDKNYRETLERVKEEEQQRQNQRKNLLQTSTSRRTKWKEKGAQEEKLKQPVESLPSIAQQPPVSFKSGEVDAL
jgi:hypothetical protein